MNEKRTAKLIIHVKELCLLNYQQVSDIGFKQITGS